MKSIFMYFSHTGSLGLICFWTLFWTLIQPSSLSASALHCQPLALSTALAFPPAGLRNFAGRAKSAHGGILSPIRFSNEFICMLSHFSRAPLSMTLWSVAHQAPLFKGFSRLEYWSACSFIGSSLPRDQSNLGRKN